MLFFYKFGNSFYKVITNHRWHIKSHQSSKYKIGREPKKTQEKLGLQKNRRKLQTYINPY